MFLRSTRHLFLRSIKAQLAISQNRALVPVSKSFHSQQAKMIHWSIAKEAEKSSDFRRVLWTGEHSQVVIMTIPVGGEIGEEVHHVDQHLSFVSGIGKAIIDGKTEEVSAGSLVVVPAETKHNFINTADTPMILYTVYAPAEHADKAVHKTKEQGDEMEEDGKDEPPKWAQPK